MFFFGDRPRKRVSPEIPMMPMRFQTVTPEEYLQIVNERRDEILSVRIVPPNLGNRDFGKILIEWKNPVFVPMSEFNEVFA